MRDTTAGKRQKSHSIEARQAPLLKLLDYADPVSTLPRLLKVDVASTKPKQLVPGRIELGWHKQVDLLPESY